MAITIMWRECSSAVQEKMANTLMSKWPRSSKELQTISYALSNSGHHGFQSNRLCNCRHSPEVANPPRVAPPV
jgi:hypothetical protein